MHRSIATVQEASRRPHVDRTLAALRQFGPLTRAELVAHVGLSRTTISQIVGELLRSGVIQPSRETEPEGPGRPVERVFLDPSGGHVLGIDLGRRQAHAVVANAAHETVLSEPIAYPAGDAPWNARFASTLTQVQLLAGNAGVDLGAVHGVGLGVPGPIATVWRQRGDHRNPVPPVLLHELAQYASQRVQEQFGVDVTIDNNIRFAGLAEAIWGAGRGSTEQLFVRVSEGVGASLIASGEIVVGSAGLGGEIGHITIDPHGPACHCGKRGCLEAVASIPVLVAASGAADLGELCAAWQRGQSAVRNVVSAAANHVAHSIAAVVMTTNPSVVVLGGELVEGMPEFVLLVETHLREYVIPAMRDFVSVRPANLGTGAGALGAIAAVLQRSPRRHT